MKVHDITDAPSKKRLRRTKKALKIVAAGALATAALSAVVAKRKNSEQTSAV